MREVGFTCVPISVLVKDSEGLPQLLLAVRVLHLARHHVQELFKVYRAVACNTGSSTSRLPALNTRSNTDTMIT